MNKRINIWLTFLFVSFGMLLFFALYNEIYCGQYLKEQHNSNSISKFFKSSTKQRAMGRNQWYLQRLVDPETGKLPVGIREMELDFAKTLKQNLRFLESNTPIEGNHIGPFNVGGRTRALAIDVTNDSIYLAGSASGGIYRSTDAGLSWKRETGPDQVLGITCLAQDTRAGKENTWYFGTGEAYGASASGGGAYYLGNGVYKSIDSGKTWSSLAATATNTPHDFEALWDLNWNIAVDPSNDTLDIVYVAILGAIMRSEDGGLTWSKVLGGSTSGFSYFTDVLVTDSGVVYATLSSDGPNASNGIWRSDDGQTWAKIIDQSWPAIYDRVVMGLDPLDQNKLYFLSVTPNSGQECIAWDGESEWVSLWEYNYISGDGSGLGGVWVDLSLNIPTGPYRFDDFSPQGGYNLLVAVKPDTGNTVYIGGTNLYESTDGFSTSNNTRMIGGYKEDTDLPFFDIYPNQHPDQHALAFHKEDPNIFIAATDGGLHRSLYNQGGNLTWESLNNGYMTTQFYTIAINESNVTDKILGGLQDNGTHYIDSKNPQGDWVMSFTYDGAYCAIPDHESFVLMSSQSGRIIKAQLDSAGKISTWARIDPVGGHDYQFVAPFMLDPNNNDIMYLAAGRQLFRNNNISQIPFDNNFDSISLNWDVFSDSLLGVDVKISALGVSNNPPNTVYIGANKKRVYKIENAHQGDPLWQEITGWFPTLFPSNGNVNCIAVDPDDADNVFVVFSNYKTYSIYHSIDGGENWIKVAGNLEGNTAGTVEGPSCRWLEILSLSDKKVYVIGTSTGLYYTESIDSANTIWTPFAQNSVGNNVVEMLRYRESDGLLVIATHGNGVYTMKLTHSRDFTSVEDLLVRDSYRLQPNPAKGRIILITDKRVEINQIELYNINGQRLKFEAQVKDNGMSITPIGAETGLLFLKINEKQRAVFHRLLFFK